MRQSRRLLVTKGKKVSPQFHSQVDGRQTYRNCRNGRLCLRYCIRSRCWILLEFNSQYSWENIPCAPLASKLARWTALLALASTEERALFAERTLALAVD